MERICIEIIETGERRKLERPIWVTRNRNGILATPHRVKAGGVSDGETVWSLGQVVGLPGAKGFTLTE